MKTNKISLIIGLMLFICAMVFITSCTVNRPGVRFKQGRTMGKPLPWNKNRNCPATAPLVGY